MRFILLDAGPLGLVTNPNESDETVRCGEWLRAVMWGDSQALVPEIADYEVRRELIRAGKAAGLERLDIVGDDLGLLPITSAVWRRAAALWAQARNEGYPAAGDAALDGDMLLAAQAQFIAEAGHDVIVATTNPRHLERFVDVQRWKDIAP
jgi:predicted nucleic acid-binding protein